jgi:predicted esterase
MAILALHGAGRDEFDLQAFCKVIAPDLPLIAPRGAVQLESGYSFFQRQADNSI